MTLPNDSNIFCKKCFIAQQNQIQTLSQLAQKISRYKMQSFYIDSFLPLRQHSILTIHQVSLTLNKLQVFFTVTSDSYNPSLSPNLKLPSILCSIKSLLTLNKLEDIFSLSLHRD